ncbi:MAG: PepSY domain-containing protein [Verrucomicrobia bacterium]|nr:PepSY domain-containing protein [Verrucomicrobiota bacterium]
MRFPAPSRLFCCVIAVALALGLAGCESTEDAYVPGRISRERAIAIAMEANRQYPYPLSKYSAAWRPQGGYWSVEFRDEDGDFGKFYLVDANGHIVGQGRIINGQYL